MSRAVATRDASLVADLAAWLRRHPGDARKAPVAGATTTQRRELAALGGVASVLVPSEERASLPPALISWMTSKAPPSALSERLIRSGDLEAVLAALYNELLPPVGRRVLGTFFTPEQVVNQMLDLAASLIRAPSVIVDPGAGVGAFTSAAVRRWRAAEVHAVDVNMVTLGLLVASVQQMTDGQRRRVTAHHADFLSWIRRSNGFDSTLTIGNPPYTRHQLLNARQKDDGLAAAGALLTNRNATMAAYMVASILGRLRAHDAAVLLLPSNWLRANYADLIREWLWKRSSRSVEVQVLRDESLFADANVAASILAVGTVQRAAVPLVFKAPGASATVSSARRSQSVPKDWYALNPRRTDGTAESAVALGDVFRVRRGAATGANHFFVVDRDLADRIGSDWVVRAAGRLHLLDDEILDEQAHDRLSKSGARCWMLRIPPDADTRDLQWYLDEGTAAGVPDVYLARQRPNWWSIERLAPPRLLLQPMTKQRFRVVTNSVEAFHTNTLYGLYPLGLRASAVESVATWLRSDDGQAAMRRVARPLSSGLMRLEPKALSQLRLPADIAASLSGAAPTHEVEGTP